MAHTSYCLLPHRIVLGVDVARFGSDSTAVIARQGPHFIGAWAWHGHDLTESKARVLAIARQCCKFSDESSQPSGHPSHYPLIAVDGVGVGAGLVDALRAEIVPADGTGAIRLQVLDIQAAESTDDPDCHRKKDKLWWDAREMFSREDVAIAPPSSDRAQTDIVSWTPRTPYIDREIRQRLTAELATPQYSFTVSGDIKIESKEAIKRRLGSEGASPDLADALVLSMAVSGRKPPRLNQWGRTAPTGSWMAGA